MQLLILLGALCTLLSPTYALYFYLEGSQMRCFLEDLPKDTLVVGAFLGSCLVDRTNPCAGNFKAEEWNSETNAYTINPNMGLKITVDVPANNPPRADIVGNLRQRPPSDQSEKRSDRTIHVYCCRIWGTQIVFPD